MKKNSLFKVVVMTIVALFGVLSVNAANTYVDAETCEGGKVYTNYYFFLDASTKLTTDYTTIGYYDNAVGDSSLQKEVYNYGIFSEEFAKIANRGYGVVPIDTKKLNLKLSVDGIGLRTFYKFMVDVTVSASDNEAYFVEHNWARVKNQVVKETSEKSLAFTRDDIESMIDATVMLNKYPTISPIINLADGNKQLQFQITRKYSEGASYKNATPMAVISNNKTWNAYLQPALFYVQYCAKKTTKNAKEVLHYEPNAGEDVVTNVPSDQKFDSGDSTIISDKVPVREGYEFLGWNTYSAAEKANKNYSAGNEVNESMTLYAIWKKKDSSTYSVVYRPNTTDTVSNMPEGVTKSVNESITISDNVPTRNGYTFLGWSSVSGATTVESKYKAGSTYNDKKDLILYAVWKKNVVLPDNPGTGVADYIIPFGSIITISSIALKVLKKKKSFIQF